MRLRTIIAIGRHHRRRSNHSCREAALTLTMEQTPSSKQNACGCNYATHTQCLQLSAIAPTRNGTATESKQNACGGMHFCPLAALHRISSVTSVSSTALLGFLQRGLGPLFLPQKMPCAVCNEDLPVCHKVGHQAHLQTVLPQRSVSVEHQLGILVVE